MVTYTSTKLVTLTPGSNDNMDWRDHGAIIFGTLGAGATVTGIVAPVINDELAWTGDVSDTGKIHSGPLYLVNGSGQTISITCESGASTAANRLTIPGVAPAASYSLSDGYTAIFLYDYNSSRWRKIN